MLRQSAFRVSNLMFVIHNKPYMTVCRCLRNSVRCVGVHVDVFKERRASNGIDMRICIIHCCSNILACLLRTKLLGPIFATRPKEARAKKLPAQPFFCGGTKSPGWEPERGTNTWIWLVKGAQTWLVDLEQRGWGGARCGIKLEWTSGPPRSAKTGKAKRIKE